MNKTGAVATLGVLGLLAAACGSSAGGGGGAAGESATFTYAISGDPGSLDPAMAVNGATRATVNMAYDTLVNATPEGKTVSGLAEKWEVEPEAVTFTLRKDITCSDGTKLTASDVAANYNHIADPASKSPLYGVLVPTGMKAKADAAAGTVTLTMPKPYSFILENARDVFIVCGTGMKDRSILAKQTSGTGPYVLSEMMAGDSYTFTRREGYAWGANGATNKEPGQPAKVVVKVVPNEQTAANMLMSGSLNLGQFSGTDRARLEAGPAISKYVSPFVNSDLVFNQADGRLTKDFALRKALVQALNLDELAKVGSSNTGNIPTTLVMKPSPCTGDTVAGNRPAFDAAAADAALTAAGWKPGPDGIRVKDGKKLTMTYVYSNALGPGAQSAAEYIADAWKKVGVETKLNGYTATKYLEVVDTTGDWDVAWSTIGLALPSQFTGFYAGPPAPKGANFARIDNKEYVELTEKAMRLTGEPACALWNQAESSLIKNLDVLPVVEATMLIASKDATARMFGTLVMTSTIRMKEGR
ncbi:peptide/nickel transport system substrate-binding protein [Sinosporangium album]|uniref:Peptide/nickel transport system substrate-binding protein n=1 Tax=Sinosporangium album TaxID=504805 RepID=A0A1G7X764_9ACTN|nr:ABC transporter substrate-binding protein [Sinosporangium album]SDG79420.1 peptide/nickel transport system substrate-binding protein [Sinosporangium album]